MIGFASRTGTRRNLAELRARNWGLLVTPAMPRTEGFDLYALDNGAWTTHQTGQPWDCDGFMRMLDALGSGASWVVLPDIVAGGLRSLERSILWMRAIMQRTHRVLIAVQDGMSVSDIESELGERVGIFVGGTTDWKLATMSSWCALARERGAYSHIGRVNSIKRIRACICAGADSFDGTSASRYAVTIPKLDAARKQMGWRF